MAVRRAVPRIPARETGALCPEFRHEPLGTLGTRSPCSGCLPFPGCQRFLTSPSSCLATSLGEGVWSISVRSWDAFCL
ncbi:MAG: hypothetical protein QG608_2352 [Actinomycetota bacterium]|nr:hypothetical protein [Actinomycetota bacterium]